MNKLINIGKITRHQGNKGEVRVIPLTDFPERFELLDEVYLCKDNETLILKIDKIRYHKNYVIVKFTDIDTIQKAINFKDYFLQIPEDEASTLREDEYYIYKLIDYPVYLNDGKFLGHVSDIKKTGGTDIFHITGERKNYMIPAAKEFMTIDREAEKITIIPIPGLLDI